MLLPHTFSLATSKSPASSCPVLASLVYPSPADHCPGGCLVCFTSVATPPSASTCGRTRASWRRQGATRLLHPQNHLLLGHLLSTVHTMGSLPPSPSPVLLAPGHITIPVASLHHTHIFVNSSFQNNLLACLPSVSR